MSKRVEHDPEVCGLDVPGYPPNCPACLAAYEAERKARQEHAARVVAQVAAGMDASRAEAWPKAKAEDLAATIREHAEVLKPVLAELLAPMVADMIEASKARKRA